MDSSLPPRAERFRRRAERLPGLRRVRRPATTTSPEFDLAYLRPRPRTGAVPVVVIPGGPGLASALVYERFRRRAVTEGLDVIMIEHRGVGLSRHDCAGQDLPPAAITANAAVDDIAAVLDAEGADTALIVGSSYGTYLAQGFGARHPARVAGMVLDSTVLTAWDHVVVREHARRLLWHGQEPSAAGLAGKIRVLVERDGHPVASLGPAVRILYEFTSDQLLERYLDHLIVDRAPGTGRLLETLGSKELTVDIPFVMETSLVGRIAFRELNFGPAPDGMIFDPALEVIAAADRFPPFEGEPFDLPAAMPGFDWPVAVVSGDRDLRTPRPVATRAAGLLPEAVLVPVPGMGHSALDTHPALLRAVATSVRDARSRELAARAGELARLPREGGSSVWMPRIVRASLVTDRWRTAARGRRVPRT
ncbi:alpha/beta hydrolase [Kocuria arenosa]|uniref:alpha/beta hydrolase n=1 Tax=Kocuria arenosa TaxID=3071446 RepID=UPI0034D575CD